MFRWFISTFILALSWPALAQSVLQVSLSTNGVASGVALGGSANLTGTGTGQAVFGVVTVRYAGASSATITGAVLSGASAFTLTSQPTLPLVLLPNGSTSFTIQYLPTTGTSVSTVVSIGFTENNQPGAFSFNLIGSVPDLAYSFFVAPGGTVTSLNAGDRISFPATSPGTSITAVVNVQNRGSASASLQSVAVSGSDYQIAESPAPTTIATGQQVSFQVVFTPRANGASSGVLTLGLGGASVSFLLSGIGAAPDFVVSYAFADNNVHTLVNGATINFPPVDINATSTAVVTILNQGAGAGSLTGISLSGVGFQLSGTPQVPSNIASGQSARFNMVFAPTRTGSFTGTFRIDLTGRSISGTLTASTAASSFSLSYIDPDTSNTISLPNNSTISFPNTQAGSTSVITVVAANTGAGTGSINSITLGSATSGFQLVNLPPLPVSVPPSQQLRFGVRFSPQQQQLYADSLRIDLNGQTSVVNLQAQGIQAQFSYAWSGSAGTTPVSAGGTIALGDTTVGQTTISVVSIANLGKGDGQISSISVTGQGLSLSEMPTLPFTLHTNGSQHFTLNFAPSQPGAVSGRLTIGNDTFTVTGTGIGSRLTYTYASASSPVSVPENGTVIFSPLAVGNTGSLDFSIQNTGTSAATISSINLAAPSTIFALPQLPALPTNLNPGATLTFPISFVPNNTGSLTATLRINNSSFTLTGNGTQPAALPAYSFKGSSGTQQPAVQMTVGLTLSSPYPLPLQGTLKLSFVSSVFTDDPSIQFASGGRTVNFTIPANTTEALINGSATTVALQTGTTAGNIILTPSFAMQSGFDLTPATPDVLTLTIARSSPQLLNASLSAQTLTSFTVVLNGFATTRSMRQLDIQITPRQGQNFTTTHLTIDVNSSSSAWFQATASQGFGGSFLLAIPFALSNGNSTDDLVHLLQSLSITATNDVGASNAVSVAIP